MFTPKDHDLSLPVWGPYSKTHAGASHVADRQKGLRFDFSVFPALYRRRVDVPNATWESGWHPWECAPRFEFFSFRHELIWKDSLYADISYIALPASEEGADGNGVLVRCEFVNAGERPVPVALHAMASLHFPTVPGKVTEPLRCIEIAGGRTGGVFVVHPLDYVELEYAVSLPADHLVPDGLLRGEVRGHDFLDGSGLGGRFGRDAGDTVAYDINVSESLDDAFLVLRLSGCGAFAVSGFGLEREEVKFDSEAFVHVELAVGRVGAGTHRVRLVATTALSRLRMACLALRPGAAGTLDVVTKTGMPRPERVAPGDGAVTGAQLILKYPDAPGHYGIAWDTPHFEVRQIVNDELDSFLRYTAHDHVSETLTGNGAGHYTNLFVRPVRLAPHSRTVLWGLACGGSLDAVRGALSAFSAGGEEARAARREDAYREARRRVFSFQPNPGGQEFVFSQQRMAATTLSNVVFPVYTQRQNVRHRPPGRWWNSLYTWDSGFIGLGLLEIDRAQAWDNLAQYLTDAGNPHAAFIQHGSLVPMQIHLAHELWNRTRDIEALRGHYAALRQYYRFFVGRASGSTMGNLFSGLLRSWDYFYNSGGWDDYPPQQQVHARKLQARATPVITTALAIRCAKTLTLMARALGGPDAGADCAEYAEDIARLGRALERHSWDEESGYYAYVVHDPDNETTYPLRHDGSGANHNMGLDGLFPLVAGQGDEARRRRMTARLFDPARLWTSVGLSAVDLTAPYYRHDGYWSGTVWFPHQWFFWKTMLDLGQPERAVAIAQRALGTWRAEVDESYHCFEHFLIETGRGCGWHQFSGLSTPVLIFFSACHCPGRLTVGFDAWVMTETFSGDNAAFEGELLFPSWSGEAASPRSVLLCLKAGLRYRATWDGNPAAFSEPLPGLLAITLQPADTARPGRLVVCA